MVGAFSVIVKPMDRLQHFNLSLCRQGAVAAEEAGGRVGRVGRPRPGGGEQGAADQGQRRGRGGGRQQQDLQGALSGERGRGEENSAGNDDYNVQ